MRLYAQKRPFRNLAFIVPRNFDAKAILPTKLHRYADYLNYFLDLIHRRREFGCADECGYIGAKVEYLRHVAPDRIERTLRLALVAAGVVEQDRQYIIGIKSMGYRISDAWRGNGLCSVPCADDRFRNKIFDLNGRDTFTSIRLPVHRHLRDWMRRLSIDAENARKAVLASPRIFPDRDLWFHNIDRLADIRGRGNLTFCYCRQGRVHTNVTRIPREVRKFLTIGGEKLFGIDIRNAQPLLIYLYAVKSRIGHGTEKRTEEGEDEDTSITMSNLEHRNSQVSKNATLTKKESATSDELERYRILCESGTFYEYLQERSGEAVEREEFKRLCYAHIFYGSNNIHSPITRLFGREFPEVFTVIKRAKRHDYARLACEMQRIESDLMIHGVCVSLMETCPQAPLITIHDAIYTTSAYVETVQDAITATFAVAGLSPSLKIESPVAATAYAATA
jgi:hypothetical protein